MYGSLAGIHLPYEKGSSRGLSRWWFYDEIGDRRLFNYWPAVRACVPARQRPLSHAKGLGGARALQGRAVDCDSGSMGGGKDEQSGSSVNARNHGGSEERPPMCVDRNEHGEPRGPPGLAAGSTLGNTDTSGTTGRH